MIRKVKMAVLTALAVTGGTVFVSCGASDLQANIVAGSLDFVKGYSKSFWDTVIPKWADLIQTGT